MGFIAPVRYVLVLRCGLAVAVWYRDEDSFDNADSTDMDNNSTYLASEADITVRTNPTLEVSVQNSEVTAYDSNNATLSNITSQLQDLFATVMTANRAQLRQENEKLVASLSERFETANKKLREEFNVKLQHEIQSVSERVDILKRDSEHGIDNLNKSVENLKEGMSSRANAHALQTRKKLDKPGQEIITSSKVLLASISEHKAETESTVANLRQEMDQSREHVDSFLNSISGEVRSRFQEWESQFQSRKQASDSEFVRINKAMSN